MCGICLKVIEKNVINTNNLDKSIIINKDYNEVLEKLSNQKKKFDIKCCFACIVRKT